MARERHIYLGDDYASEKLEICDAILSCPDGFPCPCLSDYVESAFDQRSQNLRDPGP